MHSMKCETDKEQLTLYMNNQLTAAQSAAVEKHITECAECRAQLEGNMQVWNLMEELPVPEPTANMQVKFDVMLDVYKKELEYKKRFAFNPLAKLKQLFTFNPAFAMAYSVILIVVGLGIGLLVNKKGAAVAGDNNNSDIKILTAQVHDLKETVSLSLLQSSSASDRIRGVSFTSEIKGDNKNVIKALFTTLNNDDNPNVRLVTLEALTHYANDPLVREGLIASIVEQDNPLVQSALADVMLKLQEKRSVQPFRKLLEQKDLNNMVRGKIQETITQLHS